MPLSMDAFDLSHTYEFFGARCDEVWELGIDIAISNRPDNCREEKE